MSSSLLAVPELLSQPERDQIAQYFFGLPSSQRRSTNHFDFNLPGRPALFVKYGTGDILAEASTQSFFHALAQGDRSAPGIPAVYSAFRKNGYPFVVMEKIDLPTVGACNSIRDDYAVERVASAVGWLLAQMPAVPDSVFGRISDSEACVWHPFFKVHEAPVPFVSSEAITKYINKAFSRCAGPPMPPISLSNDLAICHAAVHKDNFLLDVATGHIWVVDFQHISVLPKPFQQYGFFNVSNPFPRKVGSYLGLQPPDIVEEMTRASATLQQTGMNASLGLDKFGDPVIRQTVPRDSTVQSV